MSKTFYLILRTSSLSLSLSLAEALSDSNKNFEMGAMVRNKFDPLLETPQTQAGQTLNTIITIF